jgi:hypothetical protein
MSDINYVIISNIETKQKPDGTWESWGKIEGKGKTIQECVADLSLKQVVASGTLFKAIEIKLVEENTTN